MINDKKINVPTEKDQIPESMHELKTQLNAYIKSIIPTKPKKVHKRRNNNKPENRDLLAAQTIALQPGARKCYQIKTAETLRESTRTVVLK